MVWGSRAGLKKVVIPNAGVKLFTPGGEAGGTALLAGCGTEGGVYGEMCLSPLTHLDMRFPHFPDEAGRSHSQAVQW